MWTIVTGARTLIQFQHQICKAHKLSQRCTKRVMLAGYMINVVKRYYNPLNPSYIYIYIIQNLLRLFVFLRAVVTYNKLKNTRLTTYNKYICNILRLPSTILSESSDSTNAFFLSTALAFISPIRQRTFIQDKTCILFSMRYRKLPSSIDHCLRMAKIVLTLANGEMWAFICICNVAFSQ